VKPEKSEEKKQNESRKGESRTENHWHTVAAVAHNCYTMSRTAFSWQSDLFLGIASCHET